MPKNWRRGKSKNIAVTKSNAIGRKLETVYHDEGTWIAVAKKFGITKAMAYRIVYEGYEPRSNTVRKALGLPTYRRVRINPPVRWRDLPISELRWAIENRTIMPTGES